MIHPVAVIVNKIDPIVKYWGRVMTLTLLMCSVLPVMAEEHSYAIVFLSATDGADGSVAMTTSTPAPEYVASGEEYIAGIREVEYVFNNCIHGLKFSSRSVDGFIELDLSENAQVNATGIVVAATGFGKDDMEEMSVNGSASQRLSGGPDDDPVDYVFDLDGSRLSSIRISAAGRLYVQSITVYYDGSVLEKVHTPVFSRNAGEFDEAFDLSVSCSTDGATIHYTTEGSEPSVSSAVYDGPFRISATTTVRAVAVKEGMTDSDIAEATFTYVGSPQPVIGSPEVEFLDVDGNPVESPSQTLPLHMRVSKSEGADDDNIEIVCKVNGKERVSADNTAYFVITDPGTLTYCVYCREGDNKSEVISGTYDVTAIQSVRLAMPVITFVSDEGEITEPKAEIVNPNISGRLYYGLDKDDGWIESPEDAISMTLPLSDTLVRAYVLSDKDESLNSEVAVRHWISGGVSVPIDYDSSIRDYDSYIRVINRCIHVPSGAQVYNISGLPVNNGSPLPPGIYIVRLSDGIPVKVAVI